MICKFTNLDGLTEYVNPMHVTLIRTVDYPGKKVTVLKVLDHPEYIRLRESPQEVAAEVAGYLDLYTRYTRSKT